MKRVISLMMVLAMLLCVMPVNAFATFNFIHDANLAFNFEYVTSTNLVTVTFTNSCTISNIETDDDDEDVSLILNLNNKTVYASQILSDYNLTINGPGKLVVYTDTDDVAIGASGTLTIKNAEINATSSKNSGGAIYGKYGMTIDDSTILSTNVNPSNSIGLYSSEGNIIINGSKITANGQYGVFAHEIIVDDSSYMEATGDCGLMLMNTNTDVSSACWKGATDSSLLATSGIELKENGMYCSYIVGTTNMAKKVVYKGVNYVEKNNAIAVVENEDDPETDIVTDGTTRTLKYGNNTVVVDANTFDKTEIKDKENYTIDYSNSNAKIFDVIVPNKIVKSLGGENKGIEFINRYGYMVVDKIDGNNNNSLVLKLAEDVATYAQVKAMNTTHVEAEVEVAYKSNGKSLPGDVKVYVPCDMPEARVFYIIDEHTIGQWLCTIENGYCIFDRYLDGTYVICK